jgi:hypothetical protein
MHAYIVGVHAERAIFITLPYAPPKARDKLTNSGSRKGRKTTTTARLHLLLTLNVQSRQVKQSSSLLFADTLFDFTQICNRPDLLFNAFPVLYMQ